MSIVAGAVILMAVSASIGPDHCADYNTGRRCEPIGYAFVAAYVLAGVATLATLGLLGLRLVQRLRARR